MTHVSTRRNLADRGRKVCTAKDLRVGPFPATEAF
jgi:hypothetical protein